MALRDPPNDIVSGLDSVVTPDHSCTLAKGQLEWVSGKFLPLSFVDLMKDRSPRVGDENNVLRSRAIAEFIGHVEIPSGVPAIPPSEMWWMWISRRAWLLPHTCHEVQPGRSGDDERQRVLTWRLRKP